jgi:hypothetical protein
MPSKSKLAPRPAAAASANFTIVIGPDSYRIGDYVLNGIYSSKDASLAGVERVFGPASSCRIKDYATKAVWPSVGVRGRFETLSAFTRPDGKPDTSGKKTGCDYRDQIQTDSLVLTDRRWHTATGLHVGDALRRMLDLYPAASNHPNDVDIRKGWWLHEIPDSVASPIREGPDLIATVRGDRVAAFTVSIGAEGD